MDTLSSSVSSFKVPALHSTPRDFTKPPHLPPLLHSHKFSTTKTKPKPKPNSLSYRPTSSTHTTFTTTPFLSPSQPLSPQPCPPSVHRNAATGYATALVDIARSNNTLKSLARDVRRFAKLLRNEQIRAIMTDPCVEERQKGNLMKEVAEKGNFHKHLVGMVKMLVEKRKLGMVSEVLGEFEAIYDELCGTRVVLVSSAAEMAEDQLFGIARKVQKLSGGVQVKVRHLVDERLFSFAK